MTHSERRFVAATTLLLGHALLGSAGIAHAQTRVEAIGPDLSVTEFRLVEFADGSIKGIGDGSIDMRIDPADVIAFRVVSLEEEATDGAGVLGAFAYRPGMLRLVDGQAFTGSLAAGSPVNETIRWNNAILGTFDVPLERVDRVQVHQTVLRGQTTPLLPPATRDDTVLLGNGDSLAGFIESVGDSIAIETQGRVVSVDFDTLDQLALANPAERPEGPTVWMQDGSVFAVRSIEMDNERLRFSFVSPAASEPDTTSASAEPIEIPLTWVEAFAPDAATLGVLSSFIEDVHKTDAGTVFHTSPFAIRGSTTHEARFPEPAGWLSFDATLPLRARAWGDATLEVRADGRVIEALDLNDRKPSHNVRVDLDGVTRMQLRLIPGRFGLVQTEIVIDEAIVTFPR